LNGARKRKSLLIWLTGVGLFLSLFVLLAILGGFAFSWWAILSFFRDSSVQGKRFWMIAALIFGSLGAFLATRPMLSRSNRENIQRVFSLFD
jgi:TRAP-type C4-dicarboxylate transport system permease small subunit